MKKVAKMNNRQIIMLLPVMLFGSTSSAQTGIDFKPASTNQPGKQYPQFFSLMHLSGNYQLTEPQTP